MRLPFLAKEVRVHRHATLTGVTGFEHLVSVSLGPSGEAVALWSDQAGARALASSDETEDDDYNLGPMAGPPASVAVTVQPLVTTQVVRAPEFIGVSPVAQPLPDGRVLIVGTWAEWRPQGPDLNATIFGPDGDVELTACVGDGIEKVLATKAGTVWVGYHDMGIFGNNGWGERGAPEPIGASGLVRFSPRLEVEWEFPAQGAETGVQEPIDECEALTLAGETVWAYYYMQYPVARIGDGVVRVWGPSNPSAPAASGVQALATDGQHVALAGGYQHRHAADRVVFARLDEERWVPERKVRLVLPDGSRLPSAAKMQGLGDRLHVFAGQEWYQIGLEEL